MDFILLSLATFNFFYGYLPFLKGLLKEGKKKSLGMMTLIALAILVAYIYSSAIVFALEGELFLGISNPN